MPSATFNQQSFRLIFVACSLSLIGCGSASDRVLEETVEQSYKIAPTTSISIKNVYGSIQVYGSASNEMTLQAIKRAYSTNRLKQIAVNVSLQPGAVAIATASPKKSWGVFDRSGTVDYTIVVPDNANISRLELANGEVSVEGMRGQNVHARLGSGRMFDHNCFSNVDFAIGRAAPLLWLTSGGNQASFSSKETSQMEMRGPSFRVTSLSILSLKRFTEKLRVISAKKESAVRNP